MDTKLKNNHKKRIAISVASIVLIAVVTLCMFPWLAGRTKELLAQTGDTDTTSYELDSDIIERIYKGCYVLYLEEQQKEADVTAEDIYVKNNNAADTSPGDVVNQLLEQWQLDFESYRSLIDYCIVSEDGSCEKNTTRALEDAVLKPGSTETKSELTDVYSDYFVLHFDKNGTFEIETLYDRDISSDMLTKTFLKTDRDNELKEMVMANYGELPSGISIKSPVDFTVAFGIPLDNQQDISLANEVADASDAYYERLYAADNAGAGIVYAAGLVLTAILMFAMTSRKLWGDEIKMERPGRWYLMEAAGIGVCFALALHDEVVAMASRNTWQSFGEIYGAFAANHYADATVVMSVIAGAFVELACIYAMWYLSLYFLRPVFALGLKEYIRQYSIIYQIFPLLKSLWQKIKACGSRFKSEVEHIDFSQKSMKTIVKLVVLNFLVLAVCSCLWFFGIAALAVYSVVLFFLIKKYYDKVAADYHTLLQGVDRIANGDLNTVITEDIGVFEPFKAELEQVRTGFKKAVDEEVKSQRMKTELITNVSHDLKTPLTAIRTYIELLKKEDITEEERRSYIETLENKSMRLAVLIEDLFEVSKATSNNITLHPVEVDVVNLLKQVSIEHADAYEKRGLEVRWSVPEEKVSARLDPQKTYRIFENLFGNIQKYAMEKSRVYVQVERINSWGENQVKPDLVEITIKNMSAEELHVASEELTERFVRGDASRNTEGSGLGLAIAKSFTEAQHGTLKIAVDGDLFKVVIRFDAVV